MEGVLIGLGVELEFIFFKMEDGSLNKSRVGKSFKELKSMELINGVGVGRFPFFFEKKKKEKASSPSVLGT